MIRFFSLIVALVLFASCSQSIDEVNIQSRRPSIDSFIPLDYLTTMDIQGSSPSLPRSSLRVMSIHSLGGNHVRTLSSSPNFKMTSGIGID